MKRKYLSALLMGALTVTSVSTFTSCKDYDSDISSLQGQIDKLATKDELSSKVNELQALVNTNKTDIATLKTNMENCPTLEALALILEDYAGKQYVDEADQTLSDAITALETGDIAQLKSDVIAAQLAANQAIDSIGSAKAEVIETLNSYAKKSEVAAVEEAADSALTLAQANKAKIDNALDALGEGFSKEKTVAAAIEAIKGQLGTAETKLNTVDSRLSGVEAALDAIGEGEDNHALALRVSAIEASLKSIIGDYSTMVTDIQLFNFASSDATIPGFGATNGKLDFVQATEQTNVFPGQGIADAQFTFEDGKYFVGEDSLLVRVSPVDAELTKDNISLLNSQGKEISDLIEVTDAHRYTQLIYGGSRAAGNVNTGLWVIKFKANDLGDDFKAAAATTVSDQEKSILYAVAVKNNYTTDKENTRRVTSEYGVTLDTQEANYAFDFTVNGTSIKEIHNRYKECEDEKTKTTDVPELVWKVQGKPATTVITEGANANADNRPEGCVDDRQDEDILAIEKGKDIVIDFTPTTSGATNIGVKGFYVTLDTKYALESAPSELNAWNSYSYENVGYAKNGTYVPAKLFTGNKGVIKIADLGNVKGDVIGFRVYAVNYDGTLTDPDGRSFYVAVGDAKTTKDFGNSNVTYNSTSQQFESTVVLPADFSSYDFDESEYTWSIVGTDVDGQGQSELGSNVTVTYLDADGNTVDNLNNTVKSIKFTLSEPGSFIDGATYTVSTTLTKDISGATADVCTVKASFTKVMPTDAPTFTYRDANTKEQYIKPTSESYTVDTDNKGGTFSLKDIFIINNDGSYAESGDNLFTFNVANGTYDENKKLATASTTDKNYSLTVANTGATNLVDNKTVRTVSATYSYKKISKRMVDGKWKDGQDYLVTSGSSKEIVYCSWTKTLSYDVKGEEWTEANIVKWKDASIKLDLCSLKTTIKDAALLPVAISETTLGALIKDGLLAVDGDAYTTSDDGKQKDPYFTVKFNSSTASQIDFTKVGTETPKAASGLVHFTVKDCFGNKMKIELPFKIDVTSTARRR